MVLMSRVPLAAVRPLEEPLTSNTITSDALHLRPIKEDVRLACSGINNFTISPLADFHAINEPSSGHI